jgi:tRNA (guanosine-2'-O-)-methyltransferase
MTPERFQRIQSVLRSRQPDLTVCMEELHKPNNISAVIRTADAVGVHQVHAVWHHSLKALTHTSAGAREWVDLKTHKTMTEAVVALKAQGMQILATNLSPTAVDFREIDYTKPTAILLGGEKNGISQDALDMADQDIIIPMTGMVQSLNVSVASALILYEAQRQRALAGLYETPNQTLPETIIQHTLFERGHPVLAKVARRKHLPYPPLDDNGEIQADAQWWASIQATTPKKKK